MVGYLLWMVEKNPNILTFQRNITLHTTIGDLQNQTNLKTIFVFLSSLLHQFFFSQEHMTLHTGEAYLYTCTFCSKTFRSSANMYAHRKRNHPREYEEKCVLAKMQKA